ncbi:hypothetical protein D3C76_1776460 [compost metagenome]
MPHIVRLLAGMGVILAKRLGDACIMREQIVAGNVVLRPILSQYLVSLVLVISGLSLGIIAVL